MKKRTSRTRATWLIALVVAVGVVTVGTSIYATTARDNEFQDIASNVDQPITSVLGSEIASSDAYQITAVRRADLDVNKEIAIEIILKNNSTGRLEFSPGLQLKLEAGDSFLSINPRTTATLVGGPLEPNMSQTGIAYFETTAKPTNIAFIPEVSSDSYTVVPIRNN